MLELILVRHGETDSNKRGTYLGWTDVELNSNGIRQACAIRDRLKPVKVDAIYSSPFKRTVKTAEIINENYGLEIIISDNLKERNFGIWDDLTFEEISSKYPAECRKWFEDWINFRKGLTNYILGQAKLEEVINKTDIEGFDFISCGVKTNNPVELISSNKFSSFVSEVRETYDMVIIDTPPLGVLLMRH